MSVYLQLIFPFMMQSDNSLKKTLMQGKIECKRRRGWQRMRWLDSITDSIDMNLRKLWKIVKYREAWYATVHGVWESQTRLSDWTTISSVQSFSHVWLCNPMDWNTSGLPSISNPWSLHMNWNIWKFNMKHMK